MVKGCSNSMFKLLLFVFNFIFVTLGAAIFVIGCIILSKTGSWSGVIQSPTAPGYLVCFSGAAVFLISFFGCFGALKESFCLLRLYAVIVSVLAILQIGAAVATILYSKKVNDVVGEQLEKVYKKYKDEGTPLNSTETIFIDGIQWALKCCGYNGVSEFPPSKIPGSCCNEPKESYLSDSRVYCNVDRVEELKRGASCKEEVRSFLSISMNALSALTIIVAMVQFIAACFACTLANAV